MRGLISWGKDDDDDNGIGIDADSRGGGGADPPAQQPPPHSPRGGPAGEGRQLLQPPYLSLEVIKLGGGYNTKINHHVC